MIAGADRAGVRALLRFAAAVIDAEEPALRDRAQDLIDAGTDAEAVDELILQSVLTAGWPRALVAAAAWRNVAGPVPANAPGTDYRAHEEWTRMGEQTCSVIYGEQYTRLRETVRGLHPALDAWMVTEGYGRTLSRPGLSLVLRELCTVVQTALMRTPRQLHSHLLGALRAGATLTDVDTALEIALADGLAPDAGAVSSLWQHVRAKWKAA